MPESISPRSITPPPHNTSETTPVRVNPSANTVSSTGDRVSLHSQQRPQRQHNFSGNITVTGGGTATIRREAIEARNIIGQPSEQLQITNTSDISTDGPTDISQYTRRAQQDILDHDLNSLNIRDSGNIRVQGGNLSLRQASMLAGGNVKYSTPRAFDSAESSHTSELRSPHQIGLQNQRNANISESVFRSMFQATGATGIHGFDINTKIFDVALTFPGEVRSAFIEPLLPELDQAFGRENYFYDNHHKHSLAQPNLSDLLQNVYGNAKLIVVVLTKDYANKNWCNNVEWRKIQEHVFEGNGKKIMFLRADDGANPPKGMLKQDGYIDIRNEQPHTVVEWIKKRFDETVPQGS